MANNKTTKTSPTAAAAATATTLAKTVAETAAGTATSLAVISTDVSYIKLQMTELKVKMDTGYVSKAEFDPVKKVVYGLVALILVGVVGAILGLVIIGRK